MINAYKRRDLNFSRSGGNRLTYMLESTPSYFLSTPPRFRGCIRWKQFDCKNVTDTLRLQGPCRIFPIKYGNNFVEIEFLIFFKVIF